MKTTIKQTGIMLKALLALGIIVLAALAAACTPKKTEAVTEAETPFETDTASVTASGQSIRDMWPSKDITEFTDDNIAEYSSMLTAEIKPERISASSFLESNSRTLSYVPENICDLNLRNAWVEGVEGDGIGEYICFHFRQYTPELSNVVAIANGYVHTEKTYRENSRPKKLKMYVDDNPYAILNLHDIRGEQVFTFESSFEKIGTLKFEILEVYKGTQYEDTCISEIYFAKLTPADTFASSPFDGVITAQVEDGAILNPLVGALSLEINYGSTDDGRRIYETIPLSGAYANGGFTVTLPQTPGAKYLKNIVDVFFYRDFINNANANYFAFTEICGLDRNGDLTATMTQHETTPYTKYYVEFCYVDRDVAVQGHAEGNHYNLNLKKGWNKVYTVESLEAGNIRQDTDPSNIIPPGVNMRWQFVGG